VCGEARAVLRVDAADFLFNGCQLKVSTDESVRHIPGCVYDYAQGITRTGEWSDDRSKQDFAVAEVDRIHFVTQKSTRSGRLLLLENQ
jgi:hypothetical protein